VIRVLSVGWMTTVQDLGRPGFSHLGVSAAGAADPVSFRVANRLVGNAETAPALEMTLKGGRFSFDGDVVVAVVGGEFDCSISMGRAVLLAAGVVLDIGFCRAGARCYLAVRGGIDAKYELGSASTHALGGLGRVIGKGDVLGLAGLVVSDAVKGAVTRCVLRDRVRVTAGAGTDDFGGEAVMRLLTEEWTVRGQSNRQGIRLDGRAIVGRCGGSMQSEGVALGAIQVPPSGLPVILFVDSQTTGGYPVIANVASVDIGLVGQLRPGSRFRFEVIGFPEALALLVEQEEWIRGCV